MNKEKLQFIVRCPLKNDIEQLERISDLMLCINKYDYSESINIILTDLITEVSNNLNESLQKLICEVEENDNVSSCNCR